jgi:uracil-DNA glycosylase family 4
MAISQDITDIVALIDWYRSMGVDCALSDTPTDWLARGAVAPGAGFQWPTDGDQTGGAAEQDSGQPASPALARTPSAPRYDARSRPQTPFAASEAETEARRVARTADTLDALGESLAAFDGCSLKATASKLCFYRGAPRARLMLIGEAPGRDEDLAGKPFVGRAGRLLDKMLKAIDLGEDDVHITNVVYWRPPGNRTPTPQEALACRPFLERQIELVGPEFIVALGGSAAKEVLNASEGIMRLRGKWREIHIGGKTLPAIATLHPAYLLRTPAAKQLAWQDLLSIKTKLGG